MAWLHPRSRRRVGRRLRTLCHAACAFVAASAITGKAFGEVSFALSWHGARADACVTDAALRDAVERKLGRKPFADPERAEIRIEGEESAAGSDRFRARVTQRDRRGVLLGSRDLEAQSCASLLRAATLVVTLIIDTRGDEGSRENGGRGMDGETAGETAEPPPVPPHLPTPPSPLQQRFPEPFLRPLPLPKHRSPPAFDLSLGFGVGAAVGVLPSASVTLLALARLSPPRSRWSFDWRGGHALSQTIRDETVRGDFAAIEQQVRGCFAFVRWPNATLDACGGFLWGAVIPTTTGVKQGNDSWRVIAGPTGAVALQLQQGRTAARLDIGVALPFREYIFSFLNVAEQRKLFYSTGGIVLFVSLSGLGTIS